MATEKFKSVSAFDIDELKHELEKTVDAYEKLSFDHSINGLENPLLLRETRRDVARLRTEVRRRELEEAGAEGAAKRSRIRMRRRKQ